MKKLINDVSNVLTESLDGFVAAHADIITLGAEHKFVRRRVLKPGKVALVSGGGSGHEPLHAGFVGQLSSVEGLKGAAVTNPGSVGGAGVALAIQILDGKKPAEMTTLVQPALWENVTDEGKAKLAAAANPNLSPEWPVSVSIDGWTTYTMDQIIACKGPGE